MVEQGRANPYESPAAAATSAILDVRPQPKVWLRLIWPTTILIGFCVVQLVGFAAGVFALFRRLEEMGRRLSLEVVIDMLGILNLATFAVMGVATLIILYGAWQAIWLRSLAFCRVAAVTACVPFLTPLFFLGIPAGIWFLVVLFQRETAAEFHRVAAARRAVGDSRAQSL